MGYCDIQSAKIVVEDFFSPFFVLMTFSFSITGKNSLQPRSFCNLKKMCFYYEHFINYT